MSGLELLPTLDPTPNPGPAWLFHGLLVLTFFLHALFMSFTLGGTLLAVVSHLAAGGRAEDHRTILAGRMSTINSYGIAFTITTGIAPLLFAQVLYQQTFYPATILIGTAWLGMLGLLISGYYAAYLYKFRGVPARGAGGGVWLAAAAVLFFLIAMVHVAVNLIHSQPESWPRIAEDGWSVLADPTYVPRLIHFVLGGIALSAATITWWAVRRARRGDEVDRNEAIARYAWKWALAAVFFQLFDGFLLLLLLPGRVLTRIMGDVSSIAVLTAGIFLALGLLLMLARIRNPVEKPGAVGGVLGASVLVLSLMSITRHQVRVLYLEPVSSRIELVSASQWGNFALFGILLVVALATVAWMIRLVLRNPATGHDAA